jgi:hypothetical protein
MPPPGGEKKKFEMTSEEMKKLEECMEKPEFRDLFKQYLEEISNPETRKEYDDYMTQLENENHLPQGAQLLRPNPGFCVKLKEGKKYFINVCWTNLLEEHKTVAQKGADGKVGFNFSLPYSMSQMREIVDSNNEPAQVVDFIISDKTFNQCTNDKLKRAVIETAIDALGESLQTKIPRSYKIINAKCKGGDPPMLMYRAEQQKKKQPPPAPKKTEAEVQQDKVAAEARKKDAETAEMMKKWAAKKGSTATTAKLSAMASALAASAPAPAAAAAVAAVAANPSAAVATPFSANSASSKQTETAAALVKPEKAPAVERPQYTLVHRGVRVLQVKHCACTVLFLACASRSITLPFPLGICSTPTLDARGNVSRGATPTRTGKQKLGRLKGT